MKKQLILIATTFLLVIIFSFNLFGQLKGQEKIDSLLKELPNAKEDTNHVNLLNSFSRVYYTVNPKLGVKYGEKGLELSNKINWKEGKGKSHYYIGLNLYRVKEYEKALDNLNQSLLICKELKKQKSQSFIHWYKGLIYEKKNEAFDVKLNFRESIAMSKKLKDTSIITQRLFYFQQFFVQRNQYKEALKVNFEILQFWEKYNYQDKFDLYIRTLNGIGIIYNSLEKYDKALEYYNRAENIGNETGFTSGLFRVWINRANTFGVKEEYQKAEADLNKCLKFLDSTGVYNDFRVIVLGTLSALYASQYKFEDAIKTAKLALKYSNKMKLEYLMSISNANLGDIYFALAQDTILSKISENKINISLNKEKNFRIAEYYFIESLKHIKGSTYLLQKSKLFEALSTIYNGLGQYKKAYNAHTKYTSLKDSIFNKEKLKEIDALTTQREEDLKQAEIEKQKLLIAEQEKREQVIIYSSIGALILVLVILGLVINSRSKSNKLLHNVLPKAIADRLKKKEHPISDHFDQASIIFIDIVGFTSMSKDADPSRIVEALNKMFTIYDGIAHKYGMEKIKTIGDSYMAAAGIPIVQKDNAHRAAQMALEVKKVMSDYHSADGTKINVRIGVDCGPVVAGVIGEHKFIYDLWSDAVNTASRMESTGEAGHIQTTQRFKDAVSKYQEYEYQERGEVKIKGIGTMKTYFLEESKVEV